MSCHLFPLNNTSNPYKRSKNFSWLETMVKDFLYTGKSVLSLLEGILKYPKPSLRSVFDKDMVINRIRKWNTGRLICDKEKNSHSVQKYLLSSSMTQAI